MKKSSLMRKGVSKMEYKETECLRGIILVAKGEKRWILC